MKSEPEYAQGWAGAAEAWVLLAAGGYLESEPAYALGEADKAASQAIELDSSTEEAHVALAMVKMRRDWDWPGAEAEFERALAINENYAPAHHQYAMCLAFQNRLDEALEHIGRARELDPLSLLILTARGRILHFARRFDEAIEECRRAIELNPGFHQAWFDMLMSFGETGRMEEAREAVDKLLELAPDPVLQTVIESRMAALQGDMDKALEAGGRLTEIAETRHVSPVLRAIINVGVGDLEGAFRLLDQALASRDNQLVYVQCEPSYDSLREHPRYPALIAALGFGESR